MRSLIRLLVGLVCATGAVRAAEEAGWSEAVELRGAHRAVFQKVSSEVLPNGRTFYRTNSYTSLGTGMHAWDGKAWVPADARLEPRPAVRLATGLPTRLPLQLT